MDIFKVIGIGLMAVTSAAIIKPQRPELSMQITLAAGITIFILIITQLSSVIDIMNLFAQKAGIQPEFLKTVIKITGIAYLTEFAASICKDSGESALAYKMEFAGKIIIIALAVPIFAAVLNLLVRIMP
ncbi:MAG: stage III sporulation protein AD [Deltaproteobacteria bacterium]